MGFRISHDPVVDIYNFYLEMELREKYQFTFSQAWSGKKGHLTSHTILFSCYFDDYGLIKYRWMANSLAFFQGVRYYLMWTRVEK